MNKYSSTFNYKNYKNDFSISRKKSDINIQFNRVAFIFFVFFFIFLIYSINLIKLGSKHPGTKKNFNKVLFNSLNRADIIDINGKYLAKSVSVTDIGINPKEIINKKKLILSLKYIFPNKNFNEIKKKISKNNFFWLEKNISDEKFEELMKLGDKSIKSEKNLIRIYPQKNLFSHIIGQIDTDNNGISGLEKSQNDKLKSLKIPIQLTLDSDIQYLIEKN